MLIKRKLYSVIDEEGNLGYYLYDESTGEDKLFAVPGSAYMSKLVGGRVGTKAIGSSINKTSAQWGKALDKSIVQSKQQIENASIRAMGNPKRQAMLDKAITSRANNLSRVTGGQTTPTQMNKILRG